jgi:hypothetical protein
MDMGSNNFQKGKQNEPEKERERELNRRLENDPILLMRRSNANQQTNIYNKQTQQTPTSSHYQQNSEPRQPYAIPPPPPQPPLPSSPFPTNKNDFIPYSDRRFDNQTDNNNNYNNTQTNINSQQRTYKETNRDSTNIERGRQRYRREESSPQRPLSVSPFSDRYQVNPPQQSQYNGQGFQTSFDIR